ncbi:uncharacterized protein LOC143562312 isoform X2 [Bidens hawaiensis]|uniref:uncharacterized protein LOC143562312 isoform X2 n=1 Tax=Bidens hawaiensis TaxID=980011 RepID=UPI00404912BD
MFGHILSMCHACGNKHEGVFYHCTTCHVFRINQDCALLPSKLLIQNYTDKTFNHSHPLTLAYSFTYFDQRAKFRPTCRVCTGPFLFHLWLYKCDKCRYYVHVDCATSKSLGKTSKNFNEDEYPNLLHCPFPDVGDNLVKRHMSNQNELIGRQHDGEVFNCFIHQHPLILFDDQTSVGTILHDPMKRVRLLCNGCVKPIMTVPFYMCCQYVDGKCCLVLHQWCAKLHSKVQLPVVHPEHTLFLLSKIPSKFFGVFKCTNCLLPSNGLAYGCTTCGIYVDINCAFIPEEITHDAHPDHLLSKVKPSANVYRSCKACNQWMYTSWGYHCPTCDFYIHVKCALLLPKVIKHKYDKHPLSLRYEPAENHINEYFCEICENEFSPWKWFYHCTACAQSMHLSCVPLILQCEQSTYSFKFGNTVYKFLNVKFGGTLEIKRHSHRLAFVQGLEGDGICNKCRYRLWDDMIFKCLECEFAFHYDCASSFVS